MVLLVVPPAVPEEQPGPQMLVRDVNLGVKKLHVSISPTSPWLTWKMLFFLHDVDQTKTSGSSVNTRGEAALLSCLRSLLSAVASRGKDEVDEMR